MILVVEQGLCLSQAVSVGRVGYHHLLACDVDCPEHTWFVKITALQSLGACVPVGGRASNETLVHPEYPASTDVTVALVPTSMVATLPGASDSRVGTPKAYAVDGVSSTRRASCKKRSVCTHVQSTHSVTTTCAHRVSRCTGSSSVVLNKCPRSASSSAGHAGYSCSCSPSFGHSSHCGS